MKIIKLEAENIKRLKAVNISPDGDLIVIGGRNGQGKTSVLDSIEMALSGKSSIPSRPVRNGEDSARVVCELGGERELIVTRRFRDDGHTDLVVANADGAKFSSPQKILDELASNLTFDPLEFSRLKPTQQSETLCELVGLDLSGIDRDRSMVYQNRTQVNRDLSSTKARIESSPWFPSAPPEEVSVAALSVELESALNLHREHQMCTDRVAVIRGDKCRKAECIDKLKSTLENEQKQLTQLTKEYESARKKLNGMPHPVELQPIRKKIDTAEETNRQVRANEERRKLEKEIKGHKTKSNKLTAKIAELDASKQKAIEDVDFPVDDLGIDDTGVTLCGLPLNQASSAEQLRVSIGIGLAISREFPVLLIRDGSLLDADSLKLVAEMAEEANAQVWIERVSTGSEVSVIIEDGQVK